MGNVKANAFWEAELPQTYKRPGEKDHTGLENFIRAKYDMLPPLPHSIYFSSGNYICATKSRSIKLVWGFCWFPSGH